MCIYAYRERRFHHLVITSTTNITIIIIIVIITVSLFGCYMCEDRRGPNSIIINMITCYY